ncbi:TPA: response regulator [Patescibacteria group bacterium]|uniref:Two component transcriptional regulator, winged helix family n=1 Tax=Candidatus Gottesmanbacteria bacterium GW2011_GWA1_43_11 TaxID=1618436 RepID=A0A0G1EMP3_9BACT|nr:MAG: Two component transcriptional regulator, winged helix family [Candidatus Gottesmanbacteria bacterium GW2011_GWA1_43_11]HCS78279.1 response regulator [Patescibacteria group bacterium]
MAKILFIEDDPLLVKIYSTRLSVDGYEVISAENGEDGLQIAETQAPDLIVLDIMMPRLDGFSVLEKLRQSEKTRNTPILVYSNLGQEDEIVRAKKMGATDFVIKANLSPTEMINKIKEHLPK